MMQTAMSEMKNDETINTFFKQRDYFNKTLNASLYLKKNTKPLTNVYFKKACFFHDDVKNGMHDESVPF